MADKDYTYILIQRIYDGDEYYDPQVLGTFTNILAVNRFIKTSTDYEMNDGSKPNFISCRQLCEFPVGDTKYQLELTSVPNNPYNRIGELADLISEEPTIAQLERDRSTQEGFLEHQKSGYPMHPYFRGGDAHLQFWGWAIVLQEDGTWFWEATDGG